MTWVNTVTGHRVDLLEPNPATITLNDIAHALSRINRYAGHIRPDHYSVAEHCVRASLAAAHMQLGAELQFALLLHDAHEAYCGDISSPMKWAFRKLETDAPAAIEIVLDLAIWKALGVGEHQGHHWRISQIDLWMLGWEAPKLMKMRDDWSVQIPVIPQLDDFKQSRIGWTPAVAKRAYIARYRHLRSVLVTQHKAQEKSAGKAALPVMEAAE